MKTILVIEDQAAMRRNIALMLELEGYEVATAANGREGVEAARKSLPDLILCDVTMPEMDGYGVVQELRAQAEHAATPFIFLTAKGDKADVRRGMNFGADDYLTKPVIRDDLLAAIRTRLDRADAIVDSVQATAGGFHPNFSSPEPLRAALNLTPREAEVLLWVAQGKSNGDIGIILGMSEKTVKQHLGMVFQKLGVENRNAASLKALELLTKSPGRLSPDSASPSSARQSE